MPSYKSGNDNPLKASALIIRKYNLGDSLYFKDKFKHLDPALLNASWEFALKKIQNRAIVKDAANIDLQDNAIAQARFASFDKKNEKIYSYLQSDFDVKELKLREESIDRRLRQLLADIYIEQIVTESRLKDKDRKTPLKEMISNFLAKSFFSILIISGVGYITVPRIIDGLTPVEELAYRIHEGKKNKRQFNGAICNDGWTSHSQGRGTCSHHDGVDYYFYKGDYIQTIEECRVKARRISWKD